jgi:hypothetical protein
MNVVVEPLLDFLQCTLGKPGVTHNHRGVFCAVFFDMHASRTLICLEYDEAGFPLS